MMLFLSRFFSLHTLYDKSCVAYVCVKFMKYRKVAKLCFFFRFDSGGMDVKKHVDAESEKVVEKLIYAKTQFVLIIAFTERCAIHANRLEHQTLHHLLNTISSAFFSFFLRLVC